MYRILAVTLAALVLPARPTFAPASATVPDVPAVRAVADTGKKKGDLPLATTRTVSFSTSEGTWLSLDVSPDGKTIVFELLGDLYTMPITGGTATRITSGPAFDSQPRWSKDGKEIVFLSDRSGAENIWLCDADGSHAKAITKGSNNLYASPVFTPDGNYIVASRTSGVLGSDYELWLYHKDGGSGTAMVKAGAPAPGVPQVNALGAAFGNDPRYVYYARKRGGFGYNLQINGGQEWQIAVYDRQTGQTNGITDVNGSGMRPIVSPDGKWLVYATRHDTATGLRLRDLATGDEKWLVYPVSRDDQESRFTRDLEPNSAFTPDSKALITNYGGKIWRVDVPSGQVSGIPFTAQVEQQLGPLVRFDFRVDTGEITLHQIRDASPSPDGKRLVFSALDKLYVMDLPNGTPRRLTSAAVHEQEPVWSPDGKSIAYITWTDTSGTVSKVSATGGNPTVLTSEPGFYEQPAWSPDGNRIVFYKGPRQAHETEHRGTGEDLVWMPAAGGATTRITRMDGGGRPHFAKDPNRVFVYDGNELVSMRFDGTDRRTWIKVTGYSYPGPGSEPATADEIIINPDSDQVLAAAGNNVYLVTLPEVGGAPPSINISDPSSASFPVKRLTTIGGDFIGWAPDGKRVFWSIGRSFFRYQPAVADSLEKAKVVQDSLRTESLKGDTLANGKPDTVAKARVDSLNKKPAYEADRTDVTIKVARDVPKGTVVLKNARIITMKGDEVIEKGDLVVTGNRIACVGTCTAPAGATVMDLAGKTIIPGLIDTHAHPWPEWGIHSSQVWKYLANLAFGVTTTRDPQTATTDVLTYADMVEAGQIIGPRIYHTGPGVFWSEDIKSLDDAKNILKRYSEFYGVNTIKEYMTGNRKQRQWVIMAAKELHLMPTTEGGLDFKMNLTEALDGYPGHEHSYPIMPLYNDAVQLIAQSGINYNPTLLVNYGGPFAEDYFYEHYNIHDDPKIRRFFPHDQIDDRALRRPGWFADDQYVFQQIAASAAKIVRAGGHVGIGCHGQFDGEGCHWETWGFVAGGMTPLEALRVATHDGAYAIGMEQDLGSLEPGKLADLVVLDANPLEDIHNSTKISRVMKNGRLYDGNTLDQVWPDKVALPRMWWWNQEPGGKN
ncbi:MAG TPA: amidohydrolase family protein [Gemmatimonadales bacterium]|nr:amidohydrolase family protein [Gemmatimonadales bacterium]